MLTAALSSYCAHLMPRIPQIRQSLRFLLAWQVFVNASTSDVVATTSIEALAMGKWLVCAHHPCNTFAAQFPNTLVYHSPEEFRQHLQYALEHDPHPLDDDTLRCYPCHPLLSQMQVV